MMMDFKEEAAMLRSERAARAEAERAAAQQVLRDQFAMAALTGLCANCDSTGMFSWTPPNVAEYAYQIADAMLAARGGK